jgi:membrane protease YdiL (CAAX protease family)
VANNSLGARAYLQQSREPLTAAVAVLPLFVAYQLGILFTGGVRNGVDFVTDMLFAAFGNSITSYLGFNVVVLACFVGAVVWLRRKGEVHPRLLPFMLVESAVYALLVGAVVNGLINATGLSRLLQIHLAAAQPTPGLVTKLVMSVGAGLYEEFAFRLVLMGGMFVALHRVGGQARWLSALVALVVSSLIFSAVHHMGNMAEPFTLGAFVFRFFAGAVFAALFQFRGFAIAAWTHALYDVWVMVFLDR